MRGSAETLELWAISVTAETAALGSLVSSSVTMVPALVAWRMVEVDLAFVGASPFTVTTRSPTLTLPSRAACESGLISFTTSSVSLIPKPIGVFVSSTV
jgi:hypothetical protein